MNRVMNAVKDLFRAKSFWKKMLHLALPIALAGILSSSLQIVDTLMIAKLGDESTAGVGLANRLSYLFSFFMAACSSGVGIFSAQFWGERNTRGLRTAFTMSAMLMMPIALLFCLTACFAPQWVLNLFSREQIVIEEGCGYLRLMGPTYLFQGMTVLLAAFHKATERPKLPMTASAISIAVNILLNYALIFGRLGMREMGVRGAALATTIAAALEFGLLWVLPGLTKEGNAVFGWAIPGRAFVKNYLGTVLPVLVNEVGWSMGVLVTSWVYSTMGTEAAAASSIYETIKAFIIVCCVAVGSGGGILIGIELGAGQPEEAQRSAQRILLGGLLLAFVLCPILALLVNPLLSLYSELSYETLRSLRVMLLVLALLFWVKMCEYNLVNGILRAGGDTKAAAAIDVICMWTIAVPLVFVSGYLLKWPLVYVFPLMFVEDFAAAIFAFLRYRKGCWIRKIC